MSRHGRDINLPVLAATAAVSAVAAVAITRNFFETEKTLQERVETDYGVGDPTFARTMSQLLGPPLIGGNEVNILENGKEIFPAMIDGIQSAQRTITFENFVLQEGEIGWSIARALGERACAGVKVHFLQDAMGCNCLHGAMLDMMKRCGVQLEIFRYTGLTRLNQRTHRKLLVIDGKLGFIGGAGISDEWMGDADRPNRWRDTQYRVRGPVVAQMQQAFIDNWLQTRACLLHGDDYFPEIQDAGSDVCQVFKSSISEGAESARIMLLLSVAAARNRIQIANAYFIPDNLTVRTLIEARKRGVEIDIITPSELIDQRVVRWVGRSRWGPLLDAGVRFHEFQGSRFHCKYMIVDECWSSVGSANFDNRSLRLNEEANLNILGGDFARAHAEVFTNDLRRSRQITRREWQQRPVKERIYAGLGTLLRSQL